MVTERWVFGPKARLDGDMGSDVRCGIGLLLVSTFICGPAASGSEAVVDLGLRSAPNPAERWAALSEIARVVLALEGLWILRCHLCSFAPCSGRLWGLRLVAFAFVKERLEKDCLEAISLALEDLEGTDQGLCMGISMVFDLMALRPLSTAQG